MNQNNEIKEPFGKSFTKTLKVLELFSGSSILSKTFKEHGHNTMTLDKSFDSDFKMDIMDFEYYKFYNQFKPNIIWASPPCTCFSMASMSHHIEKKNNTFYPKTKNAFDNFLLVLKTIEIIHWYKPNYWFIENPKALMRKLMFMPEPKEVWYCQYGEKRAKPTDIFTNMDIEFKKCYNDNPLCKHEKSPRGSKTGTQGLKNNYERAKLPKELCEFIVMECEKRLL